MTPPDTPSWFKRNRGFLLFLLAFAFMRTAVADWNPIPSGSMRPTLLEGDVVLVNRLAYDFKVPLTDIVVVPLGQPRRGDVVTFTSPRDGLRLIKRLVALPGDTVQLSEGALIINGEVAQYDNVHEVTDEPLGPTSSTTAMRATERVGSDPAHRVQHLPSWGAPRNFGPVVVPQGHYWMMGDSRDNSVDSRIYGPVPRAVLIGRAHRVLVSADILDGWRMRWDRWVSRIE
jgi:signal peptidase I